LSALLLILSVVRTFFPHFPSCCVLIHYYCILAPFLIVGCLYLDLFSRILSQFISSFFSGSSFLVVMKACIIDQLISMSERRVRLILEYVHALPAQDSSVGTRAAPPPPAPRAAWRRRGGPPATARRVSSLQVHTVFQTNIYTYSQPGFNIYGM
jgi:hypothetical protein